MSTKESKDSSAIARGVANESKTPRTLGLYKNWLFDKAGTPYFAAYRGDLMSIAYGIERLESDLAARDARIAELEVGLRKNDARWAQHMAVMEEGDENPLTLKLFESTAAEYQAAIDAAIAAKESK